MEKDVQCGAGEAYTGMEWGRDYDVIIKNSNYNNQVSVFQGR